MENVYYEKTIYKDFKIFHAKTDLRFNSISYELFEVHL